MLKTHNIAAATNRPMYWKKNKQNKSQIEQAVIAIPAWYRRIGDAHMTFK